MFPSPITIRQRLNCPLSANCHKRNNLRIQHSAAPSSSRARGGDFVKRLAVITAVAGLGIAGSAAAVSAQTEGTPAPAAIAWAKCTGGDPYLANAECAQVQVPLDYGHPNGKKISVAISRVKHTDNAHYKGV